MKKFITIASIFAAGTLWANAASKVPESLKNDNLVFFWDFETSAAATKSPTNVTLNNSFEYDQTGHFGKYTGSNGVWTTNASNSGLKANSFTISMDVSGFSANNWENLFSLYTNNITYGDNHALMIQKNNDNTMKMFVGGVGGSESYFGGATSSGTGDLGSYADISGTAWKTLTFSSNGSQFKTYLDGKLLSTVSLATTDAAITGFQFGSAFGNGRKSAAANFDNIAFWNVALTDSQVASLVPEPSAFGLLAGLGALALAGARRRRSRK